MAVHPVKVIEIKLDPDTREFTFKPTSAKVKKSQPVKWTSPDGPFVVQMKGLSPFSGVTFPSSPTPPYVTDELPIQATAAPGVYHYAAAINVGGLAIIGCPDLEVS